MHLRVVLFCSWFVFIRISFSIALSASKVKFKKKNFGTIRQATVRIIIEDRERGSIQLVGRSKSFIVCAEKLSGGGVESMTEFEKAKI